MCGALQGPFDNLTGGFEGEVCCRKGRPAGCRRLTSEGAYYYWQGLRRLNAGGFGFLQAGKWTRTCAGARLTLLRGGVFNAELPVYKKSGIFPFFFRGRAVNEVQVCSGGLRRSGWGAGVRCAVLRRGLGLVCMLGLVCLRAAVHMQWLAYMLQCISRLVGASSAAWCEARALRASCIPQAATSCVASGDSMPHYPNKMTFHCPYTPCTS